MRQRTPYTNGEIQVIPRKGSLEPKQAEKPTGEGGRLDPEIDYNKDKEGESLVVEQLLLNS